jgi:hypothetical protein
MRKNICFADLIFSVSSRLFRFDTWRARPQLTQENAKCIGASSTKEKRRKCKKI